MRAIKDQFYQSAISAEEMAKVSKMVLRLFSHWQLDTVSMLLLLGLRPDSRALLSKYEKHDAIRLSQDTLVRMGWLLAIHEALRSLYPDNPEFCYAWVRMRHAEFQQTTPLEYMVQNGLIGIAKVARYLQLQLVM